MESITFFVSPFILAFGVFLINEKNRKINKPLGIVLIALGGYFFIDGALSLYYWISSI